MTSPDFNPNLSDNSNPGARSEDEAQAEALYDYLHDLLHTGDPELPQEEAALASQLKNIAQNLQADPEFAGRLEDQLLASQRPVARSGQTAVSRFGRSFGRSLAWVSLVVVLTIGLSWALRNLRPQPPSASAPSTAILGGDPAITSTLATEPAPLMVTETVSEPTPLDGALQDGSDPGIAQLLEGYPAEKIYSANPAMPNTTLVFSVTVPPAPSNVAVYTQAATTATLTVENARLMAARLGIEGQVYKPSMANPGEISYVVTDGHTRVTFFNNPSQFYYWTILIDSTPAAEPVSDEAAILTAEAFLQEHGLLDFAYRVELSPNHLSAMQQKTVSFIPLQDSLPVRSPNHGGPTLQVVLNGHGQIIQISSSLKPGSLQPAATLPVISAEAAWQRVVDPQQFYGVEVYNSSSPVAPADWQYWQRQYPDGQLVDLYTYLEILQPAEPGGQPFVSMNTIPVQGDLQNFASQVDEVTFMHVWGQFVTQSGGKRIFELQGWESSPLQSLYLSGSVQRQGDQAFFQAQVPEVPGQGLDNLNLNQPLLLPDLPADVPTGAMVSIGGVIVENPEPKLEWSSIQIGFSGGGGGGGGGGFANIRLEPGEPVQPLLILQPQAKVGDRIEAAEGTLWITILIQPDGSQKKEINFSASSFPDYPQGIYALLEGNLPDNIDSLQNLPVKVWGEFIEVDEFSGRIQVERLEELGPGLRIQAWHGMLEAATLEGTELVILNAQDGQQYILGSSLDGGASLSDMYTDSPVVIEGYLRPNQTVGGLPVIQETLQQPVMDETGLESWEITSDDVNTLENYVGREEDRVVVIDGAELLYLAPDTGMSQTIQPAQPDYVQPVWRFYGHYNNGDQIEILVQALPAEYLEYPIE